MDVKEDINFVCKEDQEGDEILKNIKHSHVLYSIENSKLIKVFDYIQKECMYILKYEVGDM